jgi:lysophospholipase L1-like esterase
MRYVALGDSLTIGNAVSASERWPNQLVAALAAEAPLAGRTPPLELVGNLATSDFSTRDVIAVELPQLESLRPDVCSVLIGFNDLWQWVGEDEYVRNINTILDAIEALVGARRTFGVTSFDPTVTPFASDEEDDRIPILIEAYRWRDSGFPSLLRLISTQVRARNMIFAEVLGARGIPVADIYDVSLAAAHDRSLVAADNLHPSGRQYTLWLDRIVPVVRELLDL